jgi:hypothetical protein
MRIFIGLALLTSLLSNHVFAQDPPRDDGQQAKAITLTVEPEGTSFLQAGDGLSKTELDKLRSLIEKRFLDSKSPHRLVAEDYKESHLFLSVVATKLRVSPSKAYFAVSSAVSIGTVQGHLESVTHNVIVQPDIEKMAAAVMFYLSALEFQAGTGVLDKK